MIQNQERFNDYKELTEEKIDAAIKQTVQRVKKYIPYFVDKFPPEASVNNVYPIMDHRSWVEGFYTGILWLCYELTGDEEFSDAAKNHIGDFKMRIEKRDGVDSHDLGFLYTLSCVAQYKLTGDTSARRTALGAAELLLTRFCEKGQFIQAWGKVGDVNQYRLIVDCLLNIPLLYWAYEETGDEKFKKAAEAHFNTTRSVVIREDGSAYHTYFFDPETGLPKCGKTHQGYSDESAWARGQAWCIYGFMLKNHYIKDDDIMSDWFRLTDYYLNHIPEDKIAYWDLCFTDGDEPRDSSSNVIAACGILECYKQGLCGVEYLKAAKSLINAVIDKCSTENNENSNGLITHATYHRGNSADECTPWGDYFYLEALVRLKRDWKMYW